MLKQEQDFVMKTIEGRDVHFVRFWFTDAFGLMKSFAVNPSELEGAFADGMSFDGSCIEGFDVTREPEMLAYPQASTFQVLPWRPKENAVGRMFCDIYLETGERFEGDPRYVLERAIEEAAEMGYIFNVGPELEFYYFKDDESTEVLDHGGYFDLMSLDYATDLRRETVLMLEKMGIPVEYSHHEQGPSQHEIDLRYTDALSMADAVMTYKLVVKEIARKNGVYASFMPKPMDGAPSNGMHVHMSLTDLEGENVFYDPDDPDGHCLSKTAKHFIAGILRYAPEFSLVTNQTVNSYKRLVPGSEVPIYLSWAQFNRSTMVRIPTLRTGRSSAARIEVRNPDPAANPYLAFACMLAAGLRGIRDELALCPANEDADLHKLSRHELHERGISTLPESLGEAVELFAKSDFAREVLGEDLHGFLARAKRREWYDYLAHVSSWELDSYLRML